MCTQKYMQAIQDQQEIMGAIADMTIETYAMESAVLRAQKIEVSRGSQFQYDDQAWCAQIGPVMRTAKVHTGNANACGMPKGRGWVSNLLSRYHVLASEAASSSVVPSQSSSRPLQVSVAPGCTVPLASSQSVLFAT